MNLAVWEALDKAVAAAEDPEVWAVILSGEGKIILCGARSRSRQRPDIDHRRSTGSGTKGEAFSRNQNHPKYPHPPGVPFQADHCGHPQPLSRCRSGTGSLLRYPHLYDGCGLRAPGGHPGHHYGCGADCSVSPGWWGGDMLGRSPFGGHRFDADRARRIQLVNDVYETREELEAKAVEMAEEIAANPPLAVQGAKDVFLFDEEVGLKRSLHYNAARVIHDPAFGGSV